MRNGTMIKQACYTGAFHTSAAMLLAFIVTASTFAQAPAAPGPKKYRSFFDPDLIRFVNQELVNNRGARNSQRFLIAGICKGSKPLKTADVDNEKVFDDYFMKYYFPMMTHPEALSSSSASTEIPPIAEMRQDLMKQYFGVIKNDANGQTVRDRLNALTVKFMQTVIGTKLGEFHPAVRYNAMLIVGDLDSRGPELFGDPRPSEPLTATIDVMLDELNDPKQIDAVRVAALIGIARHAELDRFRPPARRISDIALRPILESLVTLANQQTPPAGRTKSGQMWMRRQAVEILASFAATRPISPVAKTMDDIISDPKAPLPLRCAAAEAQGKMIDPLAEGVTAEQAAIKLVQLAGEILESELGRLEPYLDELELEKETSIDGGDGFGGGRGIVVDGLGVLGGATDAGGESDVVIEKAPRIAATQRRGKYRLQSVLNGLYGFDGGKGIAAGLKDAAVKTKIDNSQVLLEQTDTILMDAAPLGVEPTLAEVDAFYGSLNAQRKAFQELAPKPRVEAPVELGPGPGTPATTPDSVPDPTVGTPDEFAPLP